MFKPKKTCQPWASLVYDWLNLLKSSLKLQDLNDLLRGTNSVSEVLTRNSFFWLDQGINMAARAILFSFSFLDWLQWDRELLRLEGASVGCAGCINSQPTRPADET